MTLDEAIHRLEAMLGARIEWTALEAFLPETQDPEYRRSALASSFVATLELARLGKVELRAGERVRAALREGGMSELSDVGARRRGDPVRGRGAAERRRHRSSMSARASTCGRRWPSSTAHYAGRGVELVERGGRWHFQTAADLAHILRREREESRKLSRAAVETLAIIAYHEPVSRAEIEAIRGVQISKGTLDVLMEAGWVRPAGRREVPGRPLTYATTQEFLTHFGLESRRDLPGIDDLKAAGLLDPVDTRARAARAGGATRTKTSRTGN